MEKKQLGLFITEFSKKNKQDAGYPVYSVTNSNGFCTEYFNKDVSSKDKTGYKIVPYGFFAYNPSRINVGSIDWQHCEENVIVSPLYTIFEVNEELDQDYLLTFLKSKVGMQLINTSVSGSVRNNLKFDTLSKFEINYVPLIEQKRIIEEIGKIKSLIELEDKKTSLLDEIIKTKFKEMFDGKAKNEPLTKYIWFQEGPGVRTQDFTKEGTILLTGSNINDNEISFGYKSDRFISNELAQGKYNHFLCDKGDILVVSSAIAPEKFDKKVVECTTDKEYCLNTGIIRFKVDEEKLTKGYFREFLKTDFFKSQVSDEMTGIAQLHFGPSHLKKMTILVPELKEQKLFEEFVKKVDKNKEEITKRRKVLVELLEKTIDKYFN